MHSQIQRGMTQCLCRRFAASNVLTDGMRAAPALLRLPTLRYCSSIAEEDKLPPELLAPKQPLTEEEAERTRKTDAFIRACCEAPYVLDSIDMISAAVKHKTLRYTHLQAIMRRLKNDEVLRTRGEVTRQTKDIAPQRRFLSILHHLLDVRYVAPSEPVPPEGSSSAISGVPAKAFTDGLLWFINPLVRRVKELAREDRDQEGDEEHAALNVAKDMVISPADVWHFVAAMELHSVTITSELVLDGLVLMMRLEDAAWRRSNSGSPMEAEVRKNRLEFIDAQRNALRERGAHERILNRRSSPSPAREVKYSEVAPPASLP